MTVTADLVSTDEAAARSGATFRQIDWWVRKGVIRPTVPSPGAGFARRWSDEDIIVLTAMARASAALMHTFDGAVLRKVADTARRLTQAVPLSAAIGAMPITVHLDEGVTLTIEARSTS